MYAPVVYAKSDINSAKKILDRLMHATPTFTPLPINELLSVREMQGNSHG